MKDHFLRNAVSHRFLLLLLDGHKSLFELQSIEFTKENDIVTFCLPPYTTHEYQPLDVGLFGPLKKYWQQECHKFYQNNHAIVITKLNFNHVFQVVWLKAISPSNVCGGFQKSGVLPFNRDAVAVVSGDKKSEEDSVSNGDGNTHGNPPPPPLSLPSLTLSCHLPLCLYMYEATHAHALMLFLHVSPIRK